MVLGTDYGSLSRIDTAPRLQLITPVLQGCGLLCS